MCAGRTSQWKYEVYIDHRPRCHLIKVKEVRRACCISGVVFMTEMARTLIVTICVLFLVTYGIPEAASHDNSHGKVLLVLLDGLRWDLFGLDLPELKKFEENGVKAEWMDGVFITLTIPSTFSIATGQYPESHGAMHNVYFNPITLERTYTFQDTLNVTEWFNQGGAEPIWVTAINQGHKAGTIMYPGCNVAINGVEPTRRVINAPWYWTNYPFKQGIDDALMWLKEDDFDLVMLYSGQPDSAHHEWGIGDPRTVEVTKQVDKDVGYLFERLHSEGLSDITDVIIVSDHGHVQLDPRKAVSIYDYVDPEDIHMLVADYGPLFQLQPKGGQLDKVFQALDGAHPALHVFKQEDFPDRLHYGSNTRNLPIIGYVDANWDVYSNYSSGDYMIRGAGHGFDNNDMIMKSSFFAQGPSFKKGYRKEPFESVNVYMLMCELLGLESGPNNGSRANYEDILEMNGSEHILASRLVLTISLFSVILFMR